MIASGGGVVQKEEDRRFVLQLWDLPHHNVYELPEMLRWTRAVMPRKKPDERSRTEMAKWQFGKVALNLLAKMGPEYVFRLLTGSDDNGSRLCKYSSFREKKFELTLWDTEKDTRAAPIVLSCENWCNTPMIAADEKSELATWRQLVQEHKHDYEVLQRFLKEDDDKPISSELLKSVSNDEIREFIARGERHDQDPYFETSVYHVGRWAVKFGADGKPKLLPTTKKYDAVYVQHLTDWYHISGHMIEIHCMPEYVKNLERFSVENDFGPPNGYRLLPEGWKPSKRGKGFYRLWSQNLYPPSGHWWSPKEYYEELFFTEVDSDDSE